MNRPERRSNKTKIGLKSGGEATFWDEEEIRSNKTKIGLKSNPVNPSNLASISPSLE